MTYADRQRPGREPTALGQVVWQAQAVTCDHLSKLTRRIIGLTRKERLTMSAKTQKNWRELCRDLHNEQESGNLMDIVRELNGALEQLVVETRPSEDLSATQYKNSSCRSVDPFGHT